MSYVQEYEAAATARRGVRDRMVPVFDKGQAACDDPAVRIGLAGSASGGHGQGFSAFRSASDRRPARIVLRPNDGPGERREQVAQEVAEKIARKANATETATSYSARLAARREEVKLGLLAFIAEHELGVDAKRCIAFIQTRPDYVNKMLIDLEGASLITRETGSGNSALINTITDAGRAHLEGCAQ